MAVAQKRYESAAQDPYCGLQIQPEEIYRLLSQPPGDPSLWIKPNESNATTSQQNNCPFAKLATHFALSPFDIDVILIALAPEFDLKYERIYSFLQNDITRRLPSIDLTLNLLCETAEEKFIQRLRFSTDAPLIHKGLITLNNDSQQTHSPLLSHSLKLDNKLVRWLQGDTGMDYQLASFCRCIEPHISLGQLFLDPNTIVSLMAMGTKVSSQMAFKFYFHGRTGAGKRSIAEALAGQHALNLLCVDLQGALRSTEDFAVICMRLSREAWFQDALVFIENVDALNVDENTYQLECLRKFVEDYAGLIVLSGKDPEWVARNGFSVLISLPVNLPGYIDRQSLWRGHLKDADVENTDIAILAQQFRLSPGQIAAACRSVITQTNWNAVTSKDNNISLNDLMQAARNQSGHLLTKLARKVTLNYRWEDLVLPEDQRLQLQEICIQFTHRHIVYGNWGFDRKLSLGRGLNVLFAGSPGTGKTMAAEVIANELGLDLYKIDLAQVVSKYIGETEKNLDRIFTAAEDANAILFFDEADALFGKRSEVKDAHDRYANIEVGYLLQKMETYEGIAILATNLRDHLDDAFVRRMQFIVEFPFPDEYYRQRIWEVMFPQKAPLGEDVDFQVLAREIRVAGGNIKNIGLASAFYAASDGGIIQMRHLLRAAHREHQKLGRSWKGLDGATS